MKSLISVEDISPGPKLSVFLAVYFAEISLSIFEERNPDDLRPRKAIEVAKAYLELNQDLDPANAAAYAAVANAAYAAAGGAAHAAANAARAAYFAAHAAYAAEASLLTREEFIHNHLVKNLSNIIHLKIEEGQPFKGPEAVLEAASSEDKERIIFNIDMLR